MPRKKAVVKIEPRALEQPEAQQTTETVATIDKQKLQEIYDQRPMYAGLEFKPLHQFYSKLEQLLKS